MEYELPRALTLPHAMDKNTYFLLWYLNDMHIGLTMTKH